MLGSILQGVDSDKSQRRKSMGRRCSLFVARLSDKTLRIDIILPKPAGSYKWVPVHLRGGYAMHKSFFPRGTVLVGIDTNLGLEETAPVRRGSG
jgi:hypothetical protein